MIKQSEYSSEINEKYLCVLKFANPNKNKLFFDKSPFSNIYSQKLSEYYKTLMKNQKTTSYGISDLSLLLNFLQNQEFLKILNNIGEYKYCKELDKPYEGFEIQIANHINAIKEAISIVDKLNHYGETSEEAEDLNIIYIPGKIIDIKPNQESISSAIRKIINTYYFNIKLWSNAYSIQKEYSRCQKNEEILFFSHRLKGWSSPEAKINEKFSVEFKTNFGYGKSSYFYVKLKYRDIDIIPFADLVNYEYAGFYEIVKYTRSYELNNESWMLAFKFVCYCFNLIESNESEFINKFLVGELESLVDALDRIMREKHFDFIVNKNTGEKESKEFNDLGSLTAFRSRKMVNALNFIVKIYELEKIFNVTKFKQKIELFNKEILNISKKELERIHILIDSLSNELAEKQKEMDLINGNIKDYLLTKNLNQKKIKKF